MSCDYFPPTYFTATYFSNLLANAAVVPEPIVDRESNSRGRDRDAYQAILDALQSTNGFDQITFGVAGPRTRGGSNRYPNLLLNPKSWEELDDSDPLSVVRHARFTITIRVRDEDPLSGFQQLDRLASLVVNAIDQSNLNGSCLPGLTKVRAGRYIPTTTPELAIELEGEFSILYATS